jgi:hypothetical protein
MPPVPPVITAVLPAIGPAFLSAIPDALSIAEVGTALRQAVKPPAFANLAVDVRRTTKSISRLRIRRS